MNHLSFIKAKIKNRLGELWWYTIVFFFAQQIGAVINAFIGLWLVPKYIPQSELGAVLPLASLGGLIGLPLTILMMPFLKFLTKYMAQGEDGKVKALLRDVFILSGMIFLVIAGLSYFFVPLVFTRMRVENGNLSMLIIVSGIIGAVVPVFSTALQALKKFRLLTLFGFLGTVLRLVTLWIALPIRGLSGYFVGQIVPLGFGIIASLYVLSSHLGRSVKMASYWNEDWKPILKFTAWNALLYTVGHLSSTTEGFVIRHRLSNIDSSGFYIISRFAEISFYVSSACAVVLFPLISEQHEKGIEQEYRLMTKPIIMSFFSGLLSAVVLTPAVYYLFLFKLDWNIYLPLISYLFPLCLVHVIRGSAYCFIMYKTARNEFEFIPWYVFISISEIVVLYCLTGYTFFTPWIPESWSDALFAFNPCRLSVVVGIILFHFCAILICVIIMILKSHSRLTNRSTGS